MLQDNAKIAAQRTVYQGKAKRMLEVIAEATFIFFAFFFLEAGNRYRQAEIEASGIRNR